MPYVLDDASFDPVVTLALLGSDASDVGALSRPTQRPPLDTMASGGRSTSRRRRTFNPAPARPDASEPVHRRAMLRRENATVSLLPEEHMARMQMPSILRDAETREDGLNVWHRGEWEGPSPRAAEHDPDAPSFGVCPSIHLTSFDCPPLWTRLPNELCLTSEQLQAFDVCMITLAPIETLKEPVAICEDDAIHVYEYEALTTWLFYKRTNPANRKPIDSFEAVFRLTNTFPQGPTP